jgi:hypothetical protein
MLEAARIRYTNVGGCNESYRFKTFLNFINGAWILCQGFIGS